MEFDKKKLNERQKIAYELFASCEEEIEPRGVCEGCEKSGNAYVEYAGDFSQFCEFLDGLADEIEKSAKAIRMLAYKDLDEALKDPVIANNLDVFSRGIPMIARVVKTSGTSCGINIPRKELEAAQLVAGQLAEVRLRKVKTNE